MKTPNKVVTSRRVVGWQTASWEAARESRAAARPESSEAAGLGIVALDDPDGPFETRAEYEGRIERYNRWNPKAQVVPEYGRWTPRFMAARVNPLAFLTGTALRFTVLAIVAVATTWDAWYVIASSFAGSAYHDALARCSQSLAALLGAPVDGRDPGTVTPWSVRLATVRAAAQACSTGADATPIAVAVSAVAVLVVGNLLMYWIWPAWLIRRRHLIPLPAEAFPALAADLRELTSRAGLKRVVFLLDPVDRRVAGSAFGRVGRRCVVLGRGLAVRHGQAPDEARAVIAHELAHIRNRDLDPGYLAVWMWRVFLGVTVAPTLAWAVWAGFHHDASRAWTYGWRVVVLAILGYFVRNSLLRHREILADARALADGAHSLPAMLCRQPFRRSRFPRLLWVPFWRRELPLDMRLQREAGVPWFRIHPTGFRRYLALEDPATVTRAGFWECASVAAIAMLTADLGDMASAVSGIHSRWFGYVSGMATAAVVTWTVVQCALRGALAERFGPQRAWEELRGWKMENFSAGLIVHFLAPARVAPAFVLGLVAGRWLTLDPASRESTHHDPAAVRHFMAFWAGPLGLYVVLIVAWAYLAARAWLPLLTRARSPRLAVGAAFIVGWIAVLPWLPTELSHYHYFMTLPWEFGGRDGLQVTDWMAVSDVDPQKHLVAKWWLMGFFATLIVVPILLRLRGTRTPRDWVRLDSPPPRSWQRIRQVALPSLVVCVALGVGGIDGVVFDKVSTIPTVVDIAATALESPTPMSRTIAVSSALVPTASAQDCAASDDWPGGDMWRSCTRVLPFQEPAVWVLHYTPHRFDLVFYADEDLSTRRGIVIGMPGDRVTSAGHGAPILVNGHPSPALPQATSAVAFAKTVEPGAVWVAPWGWAGRAAPQFVDGSAWGDDRINEPVIYVPWPRTEITG